MKTEKSSSNVTFIGLFLVVFGRAEKEILNQQGYTDL